MKFFATVAAILSMAAFTMAAPIEMEAREAQNHGMCVKGQDGTVTQITNC